MILPKKPISPDEEEDVNWNSIDSDENNNSYELIKVPVQLSVSQPVLYGIALDDDDDNDENFYISGASMDGRLNTEEIYSKVKNVKEEIKRSSAQVQSLSNPIKAMVSREKDRYNMDGYNLDLTYVTEKIIAFGFPAESVESIYRNSMVDVKGFFNKRHQDHYLIINLCSERKYKHSHFNGMVKEFPFDDHQPPPFQLIFEVCLTISNWLSKNEKNVIGVHCKAGKGRTGLIICAYLLYCGQFMTAKDALKYYGAVRTKNNKGVTIPSQIRYVGYFEQAMKSNWLMNQLPKQPMEMLCICLPVVPNLNLFGGCDLWFKMSNKNITYISKDHVVTQNLKDKPCQFDLTTQCLCIEGDVLLEFFNQSVINSDKIFQCWFHTTFVKIDHPLVLTSSELDGAVKDKKHTKFPPDFKLVIQFQRPSQVRSRSVTAFLAPKTQFKQQQ